ncbi:MAG: ribosomal RNA small subunit methyltransferase A [Halobacteriovoraceae bacterium]|nr:ribosomal RNA small subunit methyltransferase A [Halobacteriovoraceae bacterium]
MSKLPYANKNLGQHFLKDQNVISKITNDFCQKAKSIIEVGPGPGILTKSLSVHSLPFYVIEKDYRFPELLKEWVDENRIFLSDATLFDFNQILSEDSWLVSNLPYNVSTVLLMRFLKYPKIRYMTLMFQKEVGEKVLANPKGEKNGNSLYAMTNTFFECKKLLIVKPGAFIPPPKVDSIVVSFERKETPEIPLANLKEFEVFVRNLYKFKRKQLGKVLSQSYLSKDVDRSLESSGIDRTRRAETLELSEVYKLFKEVVHGN